MRIINTEVLEALDEGQALWIGALPPRFDMADGSAALDPGSDFRLPADCHQAYRAVFLVEKNLAAIKQWPLILDEALRAVTPGGILVVRMRQTALLSIFQLANFIEKWTRGAYRLLNQSGDGDHFILTLKLTHESRRSIGQASFSFGLVTDGRKPESVRAFVDSVLDLESRHLAQTEILICGPSSVLNDLGALAAQVVLVEQPELFADKGWITRKKNMLVDAAAGETIVVAHDRYRLPRDFLQQMNDFGRDFDVAIPRQITIDGNPLPDWVTTSNPLNWTVPGWMEYGDYHPLAYVNGGVIIAKTDLLRETRWSEMLFWGQAEDIDLSRRLSDRGIVPRLARHIELVSETPRAGFLEVFERVPMVEDGYVLTDLPTWSRETPLGPLAIETRSTPVYYMEWSIDLGLPQPVVAARDQGLVLDSGWKPVVGGVSWDGDGLPAFSAKLAGSLISPAISLLFSSAEDARAITGLIVNGVAYPLSTRVGARVEADLPTHAFAHGSILHCRIDTGGRPVKLQAFRVTNSPLSGGYNFQGAVSFDKTSPNTTWLRSGWHEPEEWGVWTAGRSAEMEIPLLRHAAGRAGGRIKAIADLVADFSDAAASADRPLVVTIWANGLRAGRWTISPAQRQRRVTFTIPAFADDRLVLRFDTSRLTKAAPSAAMVPDRGSGVGLKSLMLAEGPR